mgnify:CR=1 FL=1
MIGLPSVTLLAAIQAAMSSEPTARPSVLSFPLASAECHSDVYPVTDTRLRPLAELLLEGQFDRMPYTCLPLADCDWSTAHPSSSAVQTCGDSVLRSQRNEIESLLDRQECVAALDTLGASLIQWRLVYAFTDLVPTAVDEQVYQGRELCTSAARFLYECGGDTLPSSTDDTFILSDLIARCALMDPCWQESSPWGGQMPRSWSRRYRCQKPPKIKDPADSGPK